MGAEGRNKRPAIRIEVKSIDSLRMAPDPRARHPKEDDVEGLCLENMRPNQSMDAYISLWQVDPS